MSTPIQDHPGFDQIERLLSGGMPSRATAELLTSIGFNNQERAARGLQTLALHPSFPRDDTKFLLQFLESIGVIGFIWVCVINTVNLRPF